MDMPKQKPLRLKEYDYSQNGAYFVTVCTKNRQHLFGSGHIMNISSGMNRTISRLVFT